MLAFALSSIGGFLGAQDSLPEVGCASLSPKRPFARPRLPCRSRKRPNAPFMAKSLPTSGPVLPAIVVVDHGSRREAANDMLSDVALMVQQRSNGIPVFIAHMELATPSIADAFESAVAGGANHVIVVPFFLSPGRHVTSDIPKLTEQAATRHTGVTYDVRPPIGTHPAIADVVMERAGSGVPFAAAQQQ